MKTNGNYGKLENNGITYAPSSFKIEGGLIMNPTEEMYLKRGWYKIIDNKPEAEPNCFVKFENYSVDEENKTITFNYAQQMIPIQREIHTYSKLNLETALFKIGKTQPFDDFLDQTLLSNDFGDTIAIRKLYDQCQELKDDNEYFETYYRLAKESIGLDDETAAGIMKECEI